MTSLTLQAGITSEDHPERLTIALEPEAASIYVRKLRLYELVPDTSVTSQTLPTRTSGASSARAANRYSYYAPPDQTAPTGDQRRCVREMSPNNGNTITNPKPATATKNQKKTFPPQIFSLLGRRHFSLNHTLQVSSLHQFLGFVTAQKFLRSKNFVVHA